MPKTRFTEFPTLSVDAMVGISLSTSKTDNRFYLLTNGPIQSSFKVVWSIFLLLCYSEIAVNFTQIV